LTPRDRAIAAFKLREPDDIVPTFELQFQLSEELLGRKHMTQKELDEASPNERERLLQDNAELYVAEAERLDYSIISVTYDPSARDDLADTIRRIKRMVGDGRMVAVGGDGTMAIPSGQTMMALVERIANDPDGLKSELDKAIDRYVEYMKPLANAGAEVALMWSDYCFNTGPFLSPAMFAEFVTPFLARQIEEFRRLGLYTVNHTDGNIMPILDQLISANADALHSIDPQGGMDLAEVKRLVGDKVALCGNVHCGLLQSGTVEQVIADSKRALKEGMPGGGFFFTTSNTPFIGMPLDNYLAMLEVRKELGRYDSLCPG
jgi:uroporphyrinogen decarboxylase